MNIGQSATYLYKVMTIFCGFKICLSTNIERNATDNMNDKLL